jgi:hypothetical protein
LVMAAGRDHAGSPCRPRHLPPPHGWRLPPTGLFKIEPATWLSEVKWLKDLIANAIRAAPAPSSSMPTAQSTGIRRRRAATRSHFADAAPTIGRPPRRRDRAEGQSPLPHHQPAAGVVDG